MELRPGNSPPISYPLMYTGLEYGFRCHVIYANPHMVPLMDLDISYLRSENRLAEPSQLTQMDTNDLPYKHSKFRDVPMFNAESEQLGAG